MLICVAMLTWFQLHYLLRRLVGLIGVPETKKIVEDVSVSKPRFRRSTTPFPLPEEDQVASNDHKERSPSVHHIEVDLATCHFDHEATFTGTGYKIKMADLGPCKESSSQNFESTGPEPYVGPYSLLTVNVISQMAIRSASNQGLVTVRDTEMLIIHPRVATEMLNSANPTSVTEQVASLDTDNLETLFEAELDKIICAEKDHLLLHANADTNGMSSFFPIPQHTMKRNKEFDRMFQKLGGKYERRFVRTEGGTIIPLRQEPKDLWMTTDMIGGPGPRIWLIVDQGHSAMLETLVANEFNQNLPLCPLFVSQKSCLVLPSFLRSRGIRFELRLQYPFDRITIYGPTYYCAIDLGKNRTVSVYWATEDWIWRPMCTECELKLRAECCELAVTLILVVTKPSYREQTTCKS